MSYQNHDRLALAHQLAALDPALGPRSSDPSSRARIADRSVGSAMIEAADGFTLGGVLNMAQEMDYGLSEEEAIVHHLGGHDQ